MPADPRIIRLDTGLIRIVIRQAGATARVSVAWFDGAEPLLMEDGDGARTVVVQWPTDNDGYLLDELGAAVAATWRLDAAALTRLREVHADFPLHQHDLLLSDHLAPAAANLLERARVRRPDLHRRLTDQVEGLVQRLTVASRMAR